MVFAFHTTTSAFATEKYCRQQGIEGRLIPIPRQLSAGCGIAFRMSLSEFERLPELTGMSGSLPESCWMQELGSRNIEVETIKKLNL